MWHRVAALLGGRTIKEWQAAMSSAEFVRWCAFYQLEPWGFEADNWRAALVCTTTANFSGNVKKPLKVSDFLPGHKRRKALTPQELAHRLETDIRKARDDNG